MLRFFVDLYRFSVMLRPRTGLPRTGKIENKHVVLSCCPSGSMVRAASF